MTKTWYSNTVITFRILSVKVLWKFLFFLFNIIISLVLLLGLWSFILTTRTTAYMSEWCNSQGERRWPLSARGIWKFQVSCLFYTPPCGRWLRLAHFTWTLYGQAHFCPPPFSFYRGLWVPKSAFLQGLQIWAAFLCVLTGFLQKPIFTDIRSWYRSSAVKECAGEVPKLQGIPRPTGESKVEVSPDAQRLSLVSEAWSIGFTPLWKVPNSGCHSPSHSLPRPPKSCSSGSALWLGQRRNGLFGSILNIWEARCHSQALVSLRRKIAGWEGLSWSWAVLLWARSDMSQFKLCL